MRRSHPLAPSPIGDRSVRGPARSLADAGRCRPVLFIAFHYPPVGGVDAALGEVRSLSPRVGYEPIVLTGQARPEWRWTPEDKTFADEIPDDIESGSRSGTRAAAPARLESQGKAATR